MVSIIICSINQQHLTRIRKNIADTIGVPFELLVWENKTAGLGLTAVYNKMAKEAKYPYLCFVHEDVIFQTMSWGTKLLPIFDNDPKIAMLGVAGSKYKSHYFSGWYSGINGNDFFHLTHQNGSKSSSFSNSLEWIHEEEEVVCIDGVFMFVKQKVWELVRFDELLLKGFHFYDVDFSLRVARLGKVKVTKSIQLVHLSKGGDYGDKWVKDAFTFHNAHHADLPFYLPNLPIKNYEIKVAKIWLQRLSTEKINFSNKRKWIKEQELNNKISLSIYILQFMFYRPSGVHFAIRTLTRFKKMIFKKPIFG